MNTHRQLCTFFLGDLFLGVEVGQVQEVLRYRELTPVPQSSRLVRGLINLRGQIVPAIELRRCLRLGERPPDLQPMNVVVQTSDGIVTLLVDEIGDVLDVDNSLFEPPPQNLTGSARRLIRGTYKLEGRLLLVLEPESILQLAGEAAQGDPLSHDGLPPRRSLVGCEIAASRN